MKGRFISHNEIYLMRILHLQVIPTPNCVHRMPCQTFNMKIKSFYCKYRNISKRCFLIIYYFLEKYEVKSDVCVYFLQELDCILQSTCSISNSKASGLRKPLPQIWESQNLLFEELLSFSSDIPYRNLKRDF